MASATCRPPLSPSLLARHWAIAGRLTENQAERRDIFHRLMHEPPTADHRAPPTLWPPTHSRKIVNLTGLIRYVNGSFRHVIRVNGWFPTVHVSYISQKRPFSCIELIRSKVSYFSAHVSGVCIHNRRQPDEAGGDPVPPAGPGSIWAARPPPPACPPTGSGASDSPFPSPRFAGWKPSRIGKLVKLLSLDWHMLTEWRCLHEVTAVAVGRKQGCKCPRRANLATCRSGFVRWNFAVRHREILRPYR